MASLNKTMGKSKFLELFGESPINKVIDFLVVFDQFDYSMADIAENAGVGYSTLKELIPKLQKKKIIVKTRISGKSSMYKINNDNPSVRRFIEFYWDLTNQVARKELNKKEIVVKTYKH